MGNPFCYLELTTADLEQAKQFYGQLFDWKLSQMPGLNLPYAMVDPGREPFGGMMKSPLPEIPNAWTIYVEVADVAQACQQVRELGGKLLVEKREVPGYGFFAIAQDPQGATFGLWENLQK
ncbi:MAG: VOC family protein [Deltaproteobacteria bacterium]|nr:VOC family protein [Deltaproteobacteria bacterium]